MTAGLVHRPVATIAALGTLLLIGGPPSATKVNFQSIVPGSSVSQPFGCSGLVLEPKDPSCPLGHFHSGIDLAAAAGTPVFAAAGGVVSVGEDPLGYGIFVIVTQDSRTTWIYGHLLSESVASESSVRPGQEIGLLGSTGLSTGPHLHFEVRRDGRPVDPSLEFPASPPVEVFGHG